ncbi:MAG: amidohydrolase family protein [Phycisphaerae bacterium]|jgi:N-acetylglucosamine-6-phosphate deacetylase|nr:amidohydrolase family protein [Phycisphaerae bacterium]
MVFPGFVDLQVNGFAGVDFSAPALDAEAFADACRSIRQSGTAAFLPTLITSPPEVYQRNLGVIAEVMKRAEFEGCLIGIHLEGPFISPMEGARGAHNPDWIEKPSADYLRRLQTWAGGNIRMMTIAAELEGAAELARCATETGVTISLGHQLATADDLAKLQASGARALTHLGNAVPAMMRRHDNPIWAGLANDALFATIITDSHHLQPDLIKVIVRAKGAARLAVVSDTTAIAGLPPGRYQTLGNDVVLDECGKLYSPETGYLVGSAATILDCMNHLAALELLSPEDLISAGVDNPLKLAGLGRQAIADKPRVEYVPGANRFRLLP